LLERFKTGVFRDVCDLVDVLHWLEVLELFLTSALDDIRLGIFWEL